MDTITPIIAIVIINSMSVKPLVKRLGIVGTY
ncbi:hypothetical protein MCEMSEM22_01667 [Comamonadaceae bacterium]